MPPMPEAIRSATTDRSMKDLRQFLEGRRIQARKFRHELGLDLYCKAATGTRPGACPDAWDARGQARTRRTRRAMMCRYARKRFYFEEGSETADTVVDITDRCAAAGLSDEEIGPPPPVCRRRRRGRGAGRWSS